MEDEQTGESTDESDREPTEPTSEPAESGADPTATDAEIITDASLTNEAGSAVDAEDEEPESHEQTQTEIL